MSITSTYIIRVRRQLWLILSAVNNNVVSVIKDVQLILLLQSRVRNNYCQLFQVQAMTSSMSSGVSTDCLPHITLIKVITQPNNIQRYQHPSMISNKYDYPSLQLSTNIIAHRWCDWQKWLFTPDNIDEHGYPPLITLMNVSDECYCPFMINFTIKGFNQLTLFMR